MATNIITEKRQNKEIKMPNKQKKEFGVYYWDTFDNVTLMINEFDTEKESVDFVKERYKESLGNHGADQVDIVNSKGDIVKKFDIG